ncbi:hypothetical protein EW026_g3110 [Hermanssonia centrifuga]|uniref:Uncharacterized protein n=1 Tax=Hermanssonia centrifuga TaxID=98765 RepID=A0A4S4KM91_9APHY|nr:hypothetical protein EW026_g3110 [Hermanssonia centrifuga]
MPPLNHADYQLYANQMAVLGFGLAQWDPAPHFQPVRIGDVGYTRYGGFQLLFNATDPLGDRVLGQDVPVNFEPLLVGPTVTRRRKPGVQKSAHIETRCLHANISLDNIPMNVVSAGANYSFESSVLEGAILVTKYDTKCSNAQRLGTFEKYICHYYKSWVRFANDQGHGIDVEDLLLVTGCDMTADYAMLAFTQNDRRREVRFEAGIQNIASTSASWGKWQCQFPIVYDSWGPQDHVMENVVCEGNDNAGKTQLKHNQCVFLRAFRVYRRAKLLPKVIKAGAGPHDLGSGRRHDEHPFFVGAGTSQDMDSSLDWNDDMKQHTPIQLNIPYTPELPADSAEEDTVAAIDFVEVGIYHSHVAIRIQVKGPL